MRALAMSTVILTKWGNSIGIRIPAAIIQEAHLTLGEELTVVVNKKGEVTLIPIHEPQEGWTEAFNAIADSQKNELLIDIPNKFDEEEWTW
jgi:antitoxin component of MazEF toxin-antitoxin module